ncbi:MAG: VanZ family protein, partial [Candidatus Limnocylindrales bacterium]
RVNAVSLNVLLFIPLGLAIGLLPRTRARRYLIVGGFALPVVVEATQSLITVLGRGCESADVFDNAMGMAIGLVMGLSLSTIARWVVSWKLEWGSR